MLKRLSTINATQILRPDGSVLEVRHRNKSAQSVFLHIVGYVPGAEGSVVPRADDSDESGELSTVPPPNDSNFLAGNAIVLLNQNDALFCGDVHKIGTVAFYLRELFEKVGFDKNQTYFHFENVADRRVIQNIRARDVKEIGLDVTLDEHSTNRGMFASIPSKALDKTISAARMLIERDVSLNDIEDFDYSNINATLSLRLDRRRKDGISQQEFDSGAKALLSDMEPGFYVVLQNGTKITHSDIKLSKTITIPKRHEAIDHKIAWSYMEEYLSELRAIGYA